MTSGAKLIGADEVLAKMEEKLGERKVRQVTNKALREVGKEIEPEFRKAISAYQLTGLTVGTITVSGISRSDGVPKIKIGFGKSFPSRWQLVHLSELGYDKKSNPRGFGVIRRFSNRLEREYPEKIRGRLRDGFGGDF